MDSFSYSRRQALRIAGTGAAAAALAAFPPFGTPAALGQLRKPPDLRETMFRTGRMVKLSVDLTPENADKLRKTPREYVQASLTDEAGVVYKEVAVHLRGGAGSFRPFDEKPGLTVHMDKYVDGQRFYGMEKFHLNNSVQDASYLSELFCGEVFRSVAIPAAHITHAVVILNGKPRGLYVLKEGYDKTFLRRSFGDADGNFYNGGFLSDIDKPLEQLSGKNDVKGQADLKALVAAAAEADPAARMAKLEKVLDLPRFVDFMVLETLMWHWDGYSMKQNNYRVYHEPQRDKVVFVPSGMDQMFGDANGPILPPFSGLLAKAIIETPAGRLRYLQRMAAILREVFNPNAMVRWLDGLQARVQPAVAYVDANAGKDFPNQVNRIRDAIRQRVKSVDEQLRKTKA